MKKRMFTWNAFLSVFGSIILLIGLVGCKGESEPSKGESAEHPQTEETKSEHPEHPQTESAKSEHPEHPQVEDTKSEHPEHPE